MNTKYIDEREMSEGLVNVYLWRRGLVNLVFEPLYLDKKSEAAAGEVNLVGVYCTNTTDHHHALPATYTESRAAYTR